MTAFARRQKNWVADEAYRIEQETWQGIEHLIAGGQRQGQKMMRNEMEILKVWNENEN